MNTAPQEIAYYLERLFPISRSITGNGNRETLKILNEIIPLNISEVASGTRVYDWEVPKEWNIRSAWIKNNMGEKIIDLVDSNLHIVNYSIPIHKKMSLTDLSSHIHFFKSQPDVIPYRTSYYQENWGFCISYNSYKKKFADDTIYEVFIDSDLKPGSLTLADFLINGSSSKEYLFSTYFCHPSMANDNLSGVLLSAFLARELGQMKLKNSYRFIFIPETIGAIAYCALNESSMKKIIGGYVLSCVAGKGMYGYKQTFFENHLIDRVVHQTFKESGIDYITYPFIPQGSDERQYSSPGFRIPIGSVHKDKYHEYKEYHTSADNLNFVNGEAILKTLEIYLSIINKLEENSIVLSLNPNCEPQLGKRGLYPSVGRRTMNINKSNENVEADSENIELDTILWLLFYGDGNSSILDICEKHQLHFNNTLKIAKKLEQKGLLKLSFNC